MVLYSNGEGVAVVTEMTKDLRLAAELGASLLNANEDLRQQLREAQERERGLSELVADLRRKLATSDEEILTLSAELADLQHSASASVNDGRAKRIEKSLQAVLSTIHDNQQQLRLEKQAIAEQAEAIRTREHERCRDVEAIRMHCFELESRVDTMSMTNAMFVLKAHARLGRLEQELNEAKLKLLQAETELDNVHRCKESLDILAEEQNAGIQTASLRRNPCDISEPIVSLLPDEYGEVADGRRGNNILVDFFFLTAMACKIDLVEKGGLSTAAFKITNEELYERLEKEANPVPFYQWYHWIRARLANKLVAESDEITNISSRELPWSYNKLWKLFWRS